MSTKTCDACGALPHKPCLTPAGKIAKTDHAVRELGEVGVRRKKYRTRILIAAMAGIGACAEQPPGVMSCEQIYNVETFELDVEPNQAGPLFCKIVDVPHGATPFTSGDFLRPIPPGLGQDFYAGPERYFTDLESSNKVGVLVRLPDGSCAWVPCDGGIPTVDAGSP